MGEFRRSHSKVWWSHYPEDEDEEMSPSLLPGWGPGVPLSPDRGSPSNGSHKSQDSGFSDSENSPPNPKPSEDSPEEEKKNSSVNPRLLSETPVARIPRVCLSRYRTSLTLDQCLNNTWSGAVAQVTANQRFNQSDCVLSVLRGKADGVLSAEEARTSFVIESDEEHEDKSSKTNHSFSEKLLCVQPMSLNDTESLVQDSSLESSISMSENQTAVFIPKPSPTFIRPKSPTQNLPLSPITSRPSSPKCLSPSRFIRTPTSTRVPSWDSELDVTGTLGAPVHCSTPKTVPCNRVQPRGTRVTRRPVNLNKHFESVTPSVDSPPPPPVQQWCRELRVLCEPECMTTLQSKSLTADLSRQVTLMAATTTEAVRTLQQRTRTISHEFSELYRKVDRGQLEHVGPLVQSLLGHMTELLAVVELPASSSECCSQLVAAGERLRTAASAATPQQPQLVEGVTMLGQAFTAVVDHLLAQQIKLLVAVLEEPSSSLALLSALSAFSGLGLEASHLGDLMSRCSGIRALLSLCIDSKSASVRTAALRILATVCCSSTTIRQFEQGGGVEIISDILADERRGENETTEAVSVLAQVTAPWVEDNHSVLGLTEQLTTLVAALTRLVNNTTSSVLLLLSAAAVCHLSLLEPQCVWRLLECKTAGTLLLAVRRQGPHASVFLQEQVAGLLANMAAVPEARPHLAEHRAVVALLCFLQVRHCPLQRAPEIAAAERLQHKSAIALSRLCSDPSVASQVVELQGINRLVRLCKEERERNHSDGVLVACLAALRKIVANCGLEIMDELNARELVEPRLLDSFFLYSSRQESYV